MSDRQTNMSVSPIKKDDSQAPGSHSVHRTTSGRYSPQELKISEFLAMLAASWKLICGMSLLLFLVGVLYIVIATPVYMADVLLQVEQKPKAIAGLAEFSELLKEEAPVSEVFELLKSRMVLGSVVDDLELDLIAQPVHLPMVGRAAARYYNSPKSFADPWFGLESFAWGGESIQVERFDIPAAYLGEEFEIVVDTADRYTLVGPEGEIITNGVVGRTVQTLLNGRELMILFVSELKGRPGTRFVLFKRNRLAAINSLRESLKIVEKGTESGILQMSLEGPDRGAITRILNAVANTYLQRVVELKSADTEKTLVFIERQLPVLKEKMEKAEDALNLYRLRKGSIDLTKETSATLDKVVSIEAELSELRRDRDELIQRFTPSHPKIVALDAQISTLIGELEGVESRLRGLPETQQEILRLTRDMEVSSALYVDLLNSAQELKVLKAGAVGNVRVVDYALKPYKPIKPNQNFIVFISTVLGALLGIGIAFARKNLREAVQDPDVIEGKLGLAVLATVPHSRMQKILIRGRASAAEGSSLLAVVDPHDVAIESMRSLRTLLYFEQMNARNNILLITSPGPGCGKTFVCLNLAAVLAGTGKRTLVVDADLRRGRVHEIFGIANNVGLSDVITHKLELGAGICKTGLNNLFIVPTGTTPPNPSELLLREQFMMALKLYSSTFDCVIIDSPPVLSVTDAAIVGHLAGTTLLVVKDQQSPLREIDQSAKRLRHAGANLRGVVYNGMESPGSRYGYGKYYGHAYSYKYKR